MSLRAHGALKPASASLHRASGFDYEWITGQHKPLFLCISRSIHLKRRRAPGDYHENDRFDPVRRRARALLDAGPRRGARSVDPTCKQFIEGGDDEIKMVLTWMDGWYKGDQDEAIIDTDVFVDNAKKFGQFCAKNPTISIVNAAEKILGK
jgi:hypothetical protein